MPSIAAFMCDRDSTMTLHQLRFAVIPDFRPWWADILPLVAVIVG
jgi:hypothetical protein